MKNKIQIILIRIILFPSDDGKNTKRYNFLESLSFTWKSVHDCIFMLILLLKNPSIFVKSFMSDINFFN